MAIAINSQNNMGLGNFFKFKKIPLGIYPLLAIIGGAVSGGTYFMYFCITGPEIQIRKNTDSIPANMLLQPNETVKFYRPTDNHFVHWKRQFK
ncbi:hypothetical protein BC833DRAFT_582871 [Globomyces pollinis-pini]|nr:hypothetical protein BC833DRAFT_582871 [Globomyces pollinis-pini]KAJ2991343.1 hypothetical protein HDV02_003847 [Globomyces sp. JEL0801]